jgi:hypothetical protein
MFLSFPQPPVGVRFMTVNSGWGVWQACGLGMTFLGFRVGLVVCLLSLWEGRPMVLLRLGRKA